MDKPGIRVFGLVFIITGQSWGCNAEAERKSHRQIGRAHV